MSAHGETAVPRGAGKLLAAAVAVLALLGCQQMFTYSPVGFLQTPASAMSPEQQINFGKDALASGDKAKMAEAYTVLAAQTTSGEAQHLAGKLGVELSGVPGYILEISTGATPADSAALLAEIEARGLDLAIFAQAGQNLLASQNLGVTLAPEDYIMGSIGLALQAAFDSSGSYTDFSSLALGDPALDPALTLAQAGVDSVASLPPGDPLIDLMAQFQTFVNGFDSL